MNVDKITVLITIVNFIVLYFILRHYLFTPVTNVITARQNEIGDSIKKAKEDQEQAALLKAERAEKLRAAKQEGKTIVEEFKTKAEAVSADVVKEANHEAQQILERARKEVAREEEKARDQIKNEVVDLALLLSSKALEEAIDEDKHRRLIQDFITKVGI